MKILFTLATLLGLAACTQHPTAAGAADTLSAAEPVYTLDDDIGEMLLVGFRGTTIDSANHVVRDLQQYRVGSVILFDYDVPTGTRGRNIQSADQLGELCRQLRAIRPDLLVGVDQEGGYVSRLSPRYGFQRLPSAKRLGTMDDDSLRHYAAMTAQMLVEVGIDLDFAPVADVDVNHKCPVIGALERSFAPDAERVRHCCELWSSEMARHHVATCLKHFPGHGSASGDTHKGLVDVSATWQSCELDPYRRLDLATSMVMTAHVINRRLDPAGLPASLSPAITSLLRDSLGFQGVIVTDDLAMGAIVSQYSFDQAVRMAVLAGADLLCLSNNGGTYNPDMVPRTVQVIKQMVADGTIDAARLRRSADRVRALKVALR